MHWLLMDKEKRSLRKDKLDDYGGFRALLVDDLPHPSKKARAAARVR